MEALGSLGPNEHLVLWYTNEKGKLTLVYVLRRPVIWLGEVLGFPQVLASQRRCRPQTAAVAGKISAA